MKKWIFSLATITTLVASSATSASSDINDYRALDTVFDQGSIKTNSITMLDDREMRETSGELAPLAAIIGIASLDLALSGFFWGVYVPFYTNWEPNYRSPYLIY